jgi:hypothetical protein
LSSWILFFLEIMLLSFLWKIILLCPYSISSGRLVPFFFRALSGSSDC